jgi:ferritin-like metal-binding protein YciE
VVTLARQLVSYLTDAHAIERQALVAHPRDTPALAGDPGLARALEDHLVESEKHERLLREQLRALDAGPPAVGEAAPAATGGGVTMFAQAQPDTPGRLAAHAYAYEHLELAAHELLARVAERAGDLQERGATARLRRSFDSAFAASLDPRPARGGLADALR